MDTNIFLQSIILYSDFMVQENSDLAGKWVILKDDKVIASDDNASVILKISEKYNEDEITISKIPSTQYCYY